MSENCDMLEIRELRERVARLEEQVEYLSSCLLSGNCLSPMRSQSSEMRHRNISNLATASSKGPIRPLNSEVLIPVTNALKHVDPWVVQNTNPTSLRSLLDKYKRQESTSPRSPTRSKAIGQKEEFKDSSYSLFGGNSCHFSVVTPGKANEEIPPSLVTNTTKTQKTVYTPLQLRAIKSTKTGQGSQSANGSADVHDGAGRASYKREVLNGFILETPM